MMLENRYFEWEVVGSRSTCQDLYRREREKGEERKGHTNTSISCTTSNNACFDKTVIRRISLLELLRPSAVSKDQDQRDWDWDWLFSPLYIRNSSLIRYRTQWDWATCQWDLLSVCISWVLLTLHHLLLLKVYSNDGNNESDNERRERERGPSWKQISHLHKRGGWNSQRVNAWT